MNMEARDERIPSDLDINGEWLALERQIISLMIPYGAVSLHVQLPATKGKITTGELVWKRCSEAGGKGKIHLVFNPSPDMPPAERPVTSLSLELRIALTKYAERFVNCCLEEKQRLQPRLQNAVSSLRMATEKAQAHQMMRG
jgi:hypothetical protein